MHLMSRTLHGCVSEVGWIANQSAPQRVEVRRGNDGPVALLRVRGLKQLQALLYVPTGKSHSSRVRGLKLKQISQLLMLLSVLFSIFHLSKNEDGNEYESCDKVCPPGGEIHEYSGKWIERVMMIRSIMETPGKNGGSIVVRYLCVHECGEWWRRKMRNMVMMNIAADAFLRAMCAGRKKRRT